MRDYSTKLIGFIWFMLSMKAKYGLRAMSSLAKHYGKGPLLIADIAEKEGIPRKFLELILLDLKKKGFVQSKKGKGGGYYLHRKPATITIDQLIRALDGPLALLPCVSQMAYERCEECPDENACGIRRVFSEVREATVKVLAKNTLADMGHKGR
jgi:Rrf2 family protein